MDAEAIRAQAPMQVEIQNPGQTVSTDCATP
jgi:hypothetical protein